MPVPGAIEEAACAMPHEHLLRVWRGTDAAGPAPIDAAAVFATLRFTHVRRRVARTDADTNESRRARSSTG